jgi:hypothetical protein
MHRIMAEIQLQATTDNLTALLNRRSLENQVRVLRNDRTKFAVAMADLDHFQGDRRRCVVLRGRPLGLARTGRRIRRIRLPSRPHRQGRRTHVPSRLEPSAPGRKQASGLGNPPIISRFERRHLGSRSSRCRCGRPRDDRRRCPRRRRRTASGLTSPPNQLRLKLIGFNRQACRLSSCSLPAPGPSR